MGGSMTLPEALSLFLAALCFVGAIISGVSLISPFLLAACVCLVMREAGR